ncbi:GGDEF domain-containing response regulator [Neobacillus dielmonensis]|uniref:GGDEF domain-containing response regulator n=1 Tax=Neobacillus dielmonensis TaxID=1347369 RepID=UPI0006947C47|nr:GGDEF domain-containing response regulator [Neobacillus dielmonensis]
MAINNPSALYQSFSGVSVLYVEDEMFSREKMLRVLARRFSTIHAAKDGTEGLILYQKYHPDLLIIDINMNQDDELDLIKNIRNINGHIPIIVTTAEDEQEIYTTLIENYYVNHVIPKPIYLERFLNSVQQSVHQIETKKEIENYKKEQLTIIDPLTNALKRCKFNEILEEMVTKADKSSHTFSLAVMDLDDLKELNSRYGYKAGDYVLKTVSTIVQQRIREHDVLARWGGDCMIILMPKTQLEDAFVLAESIRKIIENFSFQGLERVTCSLGVASYSAGMTKRELLFHAEQSLYESKQGGKNEVTVYNPVSINNQLS